MTSFALPLESELKLPSPTECFKDLLERKIPEHEIPGGVVVGPLNHEQQQLGGVALALAGRPRVHEAAVINARMSVRCVGPTLDVADRIAFVIDAAAQMLLFHRELAHQFNGMEYLVHFANVTAGPSHHRDSNATWEALMFVEMMMSLDPVTGPGDDDPSV